MKKNGFTLAEVLITLAIIGVVATMTLPALMTNTQEQQAKTALKKGINTLTEAAQMSQAIDGFDYASLTEATGSTDPSPDAQSLYGLLARRTSMDYQKSGAGHLISTTLEGGKDSSNYTVFFRDGAAVSFPTTATSFSNEKFHQVQDDNLVYGIPVLYDTNGLKGPNIISNCNGNSKGIEDESGTKAQGEDQSLDDYCKQSSRVIKDQFAVRLRNGYAVPNSPAARWTFEN